MPSCRGRACQPTAGAWLQPTGIQSARQPPSFIIGGAQRELLVALTEDAWSMLQNATSRSASTCLRLHPVVQYSRTNGRRARVLPPLRAGMGMCWLCVELTGLMLVVQADGG